MTILAIGEAGALHIHRWIVIIVDVVVGDDRQRKEDRVHLRLLAGHDADRRNERFIACRAAVLRHRETRELVVLPEGEEAALVGDVGDDRHRPARLLQRLTDADPHVARRPYRVHGLRMRGEIFEHFRFRDRARPHTVKVAGDLDIGVGFRCFKERLVLGHRIRGPGLPVHENDISLAAKLLHDPVALQLGVEIGIARDVDGLGTIDRRVDGDDEDALVEGVADTGAEARRRARIHHDEIATLRDLCLQLRELEVDVAVRIGDDQLVLGQSLLGELRRHVLKLGDEIGAPGIAEIGIVMTDLPGRLVGLPVGQWVGDKFRRVPIALIILLGVLRNVRQRRRLLLGCRTFIREGLRIEKA